MTEWVNHKITKITKTAMLVNTIARHHHAWEAVQNAVRNVRDWLTGTRCPVGPLNKRVIHSCEDLPERPVMLALPFVVGVARDCSSL